MIAATRSAFILFYHMEVWGSFLQINMWGTFFFNFFWNLGNYYVSLDQRQQSLRRKTFYIYSTPANLNQEFMFPFAEVHKTSPTKHLWTGSWHNKQVIQYVKLAHIATPSGLSPLPLTHGHAAQSENGAFQRCVRTCGEDLLPPSPKNAHVHERCCSAACAPAKMPSSQILIAKKPEIWIRLFFWLIFTEKADVFLTPYTLPPPTPPPLNSRLVIHFCITVPTK